MFSALSSSHFSSYFVFPLSLSPNRSGGREEGKAKRVNLREGENCEGGASLLLPALQSGCFAVPGPIERERKRGITHFPLSLPGRQTNSSTFLVHPPSGWASEL